MNPAPFPMPPAGPMPDAWLTRGVPSRRVLAWLLDCVLLGLLLFALHAVLLTVGLLTLGLGLPLLAVLPAVPFLYGWVLIALCGATPGQAAVGLAVRTDSDLSPPDALQAFLWTLGFAATVATGMVLLLVALLTTRHRALHDMLAGVTVVRARELRRLPPFVRERGGWEQGRRPA